MVGGNREKTGAKHSVGACGEYVNTVTATARKRKTAFQALALADPVFLHQPHFVRPTLKRTQAFEQLFGKVGDFQKPLAEFAPFHLCARTPPFAVNHLLVGKHSHIDRIPVDRRFLAVDKTSLQQL